MCAPARVESGSVRGWMWICIVGDASRSIARVLSGCKQTGGATLSSSRRADKQAGWVKVGVYGHENKESFL